MMREPFSLVAPETKRLWWCRHCGVPLLKPVCEKCQREGVRVCSDMKPVFRGEHRRPTDTLPLKQAECRWEEGLWSRRRTFWFNGTRVMQVGVDGSTEPVRRPRAFTRPVRDGVSGRTLYVANRSSLDKLESEALAFISKITREHPGRRPVVAFSGGKDSTVVSHLVCAALRTRNILHVFGDTTMEYPDTYRYILRFRRNSPRTPFVQGASHHSFTEMCKLIGPPSRMNAWCCSVFKAAPISAALSRSEGTQGVISFEGIRRAESHRRRNRQPTFQNKKIARQLSAYPILDWREVEVWLYILSKGLDFNDAYRRGFSRVGCLYCPNNVSSNESLIRTYYPTQARGWETFLRDFARSCGKSDPVEYVASGAWKMRIGAGEGRAGASVRKTPCLKNPNAMHLILDKETDNGLFERFKPFGKLDAYSDTVGSGVVVSDSASGEKLFVVKKVRDIDILRRESKLDPRWKLGREFLCVDLLTSRRAFTTMRTIERQVKKSQVCVACGACVGVCPANAIAVNPHFRILAEKCVHCGRCLSTKYLRDSCVALHALQQSTKYRDGNRI